MPTGPWGSRPAGTQLARRRGMRRVWLAFAVVVAASFAVLGFTGVRIYQEAPPIPERVVTTDGREVIGPGTVGAGQNVWQALGGMEMGSVWGLSLIHI